MKRKICSLIMCIIILITGFGPLNTTMAKGPTYKQIDDVFYTLDECKIYAEPSYTSTVLTVIGENVPIRVIGYYSNGWYRINIGVIAYCKMDSLTTSGDIGVVDASDPQAFYAKQIADSMGYEFHYLKLNSKKTIKKDVFNSYVGKKVILFVKLDDEVAVSFKMIYADDVKKDINLGFGKTVTDGNLGSRIIDLMAPSDVELWGQIAIFQFKVGYDKGVDMYIWNLNDLEYKLMNTYYTEFSEYAYCPVTQISHMHIVESEVNFSLNSSEREIMSNISKGIKYLNYDDKGYVKGIKSKLRLDTEYLDYSD